MFTSYIMKKGENIMNTGKIKRFVKEHKKEIIIAVVCAGLGVHYGKKHFGVSADEMKLVKELREFKGKNLFKDIYEVQKGSNNLKVCRPAVEQHVSDIDEAIKLCFGSRNPETTGFVVFTK